MKVEEYVVKSGTLLSLYIHTQFGVITLRACTKCSQTETSGLKTDKLRMPFTEFLFKNVCIRFPNCFLGTMVQLLEYLIS